APPLTEPTPAKRSVGRAPKSNNAPKSPRKAASKPSARPGKAAKRPGIHTAPAPRIRPSAASIARLRKKLGMTVAEFATELGVTPTTVNRWEAAGGPLSLQQRPLHALAKLHEK